MQKINAVIPKDTASYPETVLQFGEGNFLRAFADWMIHRANQQGLYRGSVVLCQPIAAGMADKLNAQDGLYTLVMRGIADGKPVERMEPITAVSRCINPYTDYEALLSVARAETLQVVISNTTEAGIAYHAGDKPTDTPPQSYPAKVCAFLYARYQAFSGAANKGLLFLPVELIDSNGAALKRIVLQYAEEWALDAGFIRWVNESNHFCSTLVDRIVTGYPRDQIDSFTQKLGYTDDCLVTSEVFNLWVIAGKKEWADLLPIHKTDAHVIWTDDVTPYKKRKVRILNGGHTACVLAAYLSGHESVLEMMHDPVFAQYLDRVLYDEVIPTLDLPRAELIQFAADVKDRFRNPYIKHRLLDISLNSCAKWCARVLPSLLEFVAARGALPQALTFSLATFMQFYKGTLENGVYTGRRADGTPYPIRDDADVLTFFAEVWATGGSHTVAEAVLGNAAFWDGRDLTRIPGLTDAVAGYLDAMAAHPVRDVVASLLTGGMP